MKKNNLLILPALFLAITMVSCKTNSSQMDPENQDKPEFITQDFIAEFTGEYQYVGPDTLPIPKCDSPYHVWRANVAVKGTSNILKEFTGFFDFCGDMEGNYGNADAYLTDAPGDTIFLTCQGQVITGKLDDHADYVKDYWRDPFEITGGTGKYAAASGKGATDDYNSIEDQNSHHRWKGSITIQK